MKKKKLTRHDVGMKVESELQDQENLKILLVPVSGED